MIRHFHGDEDSNGGPLGCDAVSEGHPTIPHRYLMSQPRPRLEFPRELAARQILRLAAWVFCFVARVCLRVCIYIYIYRFFCTKRIELQITKAEVKIEKCGFIYN